MKNILILILILGISCSNSLKTNETNESEIMQNHYDHPPARKVKNIILMIGDGMGVSQIFAGMVANNGKLNICNFKKIGFSTTHSANSFITDSGAGATALATGKKANNAAISLDPNGKILKTILEYARDNKKATGLIATSSITHATPACFAAHNASRENHNDIALDIYKCGVDVLLGGGKMHFQGRTDVKFLLDSMKINGYQIVDNLNEIKPNYVKIAGLLSEQDMASVNAGRGNFLPEATKKAIEILSKDEDGFFLMVEGSQIDWGGHANDIAYVTSEMIDFDKAIGEALKFVSKDPNTLLIVTADHETGGLAISGGNYETGEVTASFTSDGHTGVMVPVFAFGQSADSFTGFYDNTEIFNKMMAVFGFGI